MLFGGEERIRDFVRVAKIMVIILQQECFSGDESLVVHWMCRLWEMIICCTSVGYRKISHRHLVCTALNASQ
jgi:hypothetical protein